MFGYNGKILIVDLCTGDIEEKPLTEEYAKKYIGGIGLGIRLLHDYSKRGVEAFSPDNPLILTTGPLGGTLAPTGGNGHAFVAKSPLTGGVGESKSHGFFGAELKRAGFDAIIFRGKSETPVYLWIDDGDVSINSAKQLWSLSPHETIDRIQERHGDRSIRVSAIGLGGENLVRIAGIMNDEERFAGRAGLGAVMGYKKLKAIAVRGYKDIKVAEPENFKKICEKLTEKAKGPATRKYRTLGTPENVLVFNGKGILPTRNFRESVFEYAEEVSGETLNEKYVVKIVGCASCPMRCQHVALVREGEFKGAKARVEYESLWALGPNCGIGRLDAIINAIEICNRYCIDTISTGVIIGFAMDLYEEGILKKEDLNGLDLKFGNYKAALELIHMIVKREGIGDILAEGVKRAAERIGKGAEKYAQHIKGLEMTGYDIRALKTAALGYAVSFRGADHNRHGSYGYDIKEVVDRFKAEKGRGKLVADMEDKYTIIDSLIVCKFSRGIYEWYDDLANLYTYVTGMKVTPEELRKTGERINVLARLYNIREGFGRKDDHLPPKVHMVPIPDGPSKNSLVTKTELNLLLDDYYEYRGWDKKGVPTEEKLKELGLEDLLWIVKGGEE
ncbi:aldehyde ferredoxin oxidoreductase [Candidatus Bathyarchaeota archaeon ex4484_205]|nr:MAG: aldehyde ferredoxin oxidoreductase [Candidatus Bathyarchaeota archaeon ex4484_205]